MSDLNGDFLSAPVETELSAYLHAKAGRLGVPVSGNFELTPRCNFNCKMCYIHSGNKGRQEDELTAREWLSIGKQAADSGMVFLLLTGGEPLLRSDFAEIYTGLKKLGLVISVNTNASLLCGDNLELFKNDPPTRLNVSLYGANDETYGELCENRCFSQVVRNIEAAADAGIQIKLNYSVTPYNCGDMEKIYDFARKNHFHVQSSPYMYPPLRGGIAEYGENQGRFTPEQAAYYRAKIELLCSGKERFAEKAARLEELLQSPVPDARKKDCRTHCRAGRSNCWVDWQGNMGMCGMIPAGENNVLRKGFTACWEKVREETARIRLPLKCAGCKYAPVCSVCAAVCLCETGSFDAAPDYVCRYSRSTYENIMKLKGE